MSVKHNLVRYLLALGVFYALSAHALIFTRAASQHAQVVGRLQTAVVQAGGNFSSIARCYDIGYYELVEANPAVNPDHPHVGTLLIVPSRYVLPERPRKGGVVVNLAELRLYYFLPHSNRVYSFPVGIGREGWQTPLGQLHIMEKIKEPTWFVPESIRQARAKEGVSLPKRVPPGPNNPLGHFALRLSNATYLIHGTNHPSGVGRRSSAGCLRMYPEDIQLLFSLVKEGTPVRIIDHSDKLGWQGDTLFLESHLPLQEDQAHDEADLAALVEQVHAQLPEKDERSLWQQVYLVKQQHIGVPVQVAGE